MLNVHSLMTEQAGNDSLIPWILLGICAVAVVIALIVGYQKGFRRIGFGGLTVCAACGLYFVVERWLVGVNPINAIALPETLTPPVQALVHSAITAVACSIVSLIGFGVLSLLVRPSEGEMEKQVLIAPTEYGDEYDDDDWDEDDHFDVRSLGKGMKNINQPCLFNRLLGAGANAVGVLFITALVIGTLLLAGYVTPFKDSFLKTTYETEWVIKVLGYVRSYWLDFLIIAILTGFISNGYQSGIFDGIRAVITSVGYLAAFAGGVYLAFSPWTEEGQALAFLNNFVAMVATPLQEATPLVSPEIAVVVGKVAVGIALGVVLDLVVLLISWLLGKCADVSVDGGFIGFVDGILSAVFHVAIGALIVCLLALILYCLQQYNVFAVGDLFNENTSLMKGLFTLFEEWVLPLLQSHFNLGA